MSALLCRTHFLLAVRPWSRRPGAAGVWALAAGAAVARADGSPLDRLPWGHTRGCLRRALAEAWAVSNPKGVARCLRWLRDEGQRIEFRSLHAFVGTASEPEYESWARSQPMEERGRIAFVRRHAAQFRHGDLLAWDRVRTINLCRQAFSAGWLEEPAAWCEVLDAARDLQAAFGSWDELWDNYALGWRYWQRGADLRPDLARAADWLSHQPASPWRRLDWRLPLAV